MLDSETKKNIDEARNILVGKLPNPISQVEQITIALIYKFMSDMDREAVEVFKGKPKFFTGKFKDYDWQNLFAPKLGGHEILKLYADGIEKMNINPNIPALFREVFKNAYLPYRDPETLKMFLKTINKFSYDHSERLGDAYEYLLSVLGMQGDAGQFRTQRHIIDFMVKCVEPTKHDRICDPACGTAGFVISSYKYIRDSNTDDKGKLKLTPDERKRLSNSLYGYDIDPTMVRFALVNMYLHGFISPHIYEYDTLTSEERWDERFDVILANPPFMSPSGGIRPHKRFSIQASKSEVLFTDYIHEHINQNGRGGIIVPNGIVATTQTAYKQLRETLVKESLIAVVSLPAGVFNPYSGVKTSILLLDKKLAKPTNKILFVKIENDGYDLGAQRREIDKNDLPDAITIVTAFKQMLKKEITENKLIKLMEKLKFGMLVEREKILGNKDIALNVERYKEGTVNLLAQYEQISIGEICEINPPKSGLKDFDVNIEVSFIPMADLPQEKMKFEAEKIEKLKNVYKGYTYFQENDVLLAKITPCFENGKIAIPTKLKNNIGFGSTEYFVLRAKESVLPEWIYFFVSSDKFRLEGKPKMGGAAGQQRLPKHFIEGFQIPLPPIEVQRAIVAEIESYQKIIDGARQVVENYKPRISVNPKWKIVELGEVITKVTNLVEPQKHKGEVAYIGLENIGQRTGRLSTKELANTNYQSIKSTKIAFKKNDVLYGKLRPILNKVWVAEFEGICSTDIFVLRPLPKLINADFLKTTLLSDAFNEVVLNGVTGAQLPRVSYNYFETMKIPLPDLATQELIVKETNAELVAIEANKTLIEILEGKIKSKISEVWGE